MDFFQILLICTTGFINLILLVCLLNHIDKKYAETRALLLLNHHDLNQRINDLEKCIDRLEAKKRAVKK